MKIKNRLTIIVFFTIIIGFFVINIFDSDEKISTSERRKLTQFPKIEFNKLDNISIDFENYATDQFFYRDRFRNLKSHTEFFAFGKKDVYSLSLYEEGIVKIGDLNEKSIVNATKNMNQVYEKYLKNLNVYYTIIPDKSSYIKEKEEYLTYNFEELEKIVKENIKNIKYIRIFDELDYESYYKTDSHWRQEKLFLVADKISKEIYGENIKSKYEIQKLGDYYGVYYGQLQFKLDSDTIYYLTNDEIESATVYNYETKQKTKVYDMSRINALDKYDIFLSGATPLLEITNNKVKDSNELIIFRDSFASSLIPLLIEKYQKIIAVDLRYISSSLLENYIEFKNQDVLFIYSSSLLNNSFSLK